MEGIQPLQETNAAIQIQCLQIGSDASERSEIRAIAHDYGRVKIDVVFHVPHDVVLHEVLDRFYFFPCKKI